MKTLTPDALLQAIERGQIHPLYLFTGPLPQGKRRVSHDPPEEYLRRQAARALIDRALGPASQAFNLVTFSLPETTLAKIVDAARQLPALSSRRVVLVRDMDKALKAGGGPESESPQPVADSPGAQELIEYLKHPNESTALVFFYDKPDRRLNLTTALLKTCTVVEFCPLTESEAAAWAQKYLRQRDCFMDDATVGLLIGRVGTELTRLINELDKLIAYVGRGPIGRAEVQALVPYVKEHSNFELSDAILARDRRRALKLLRHQLEAAEPPVMLLGAIASLYRRMLLAKDLMARGAPNSEVAKAVGMSPYHVGRFNEQVRRIEMREIQQGIRRIAEVDRAIKSSLGPPALQLEFLVYELCGSPH